MRSPNVALQGEAGSVLLAALVFLVLLSLLAMGMSRTGLL